MVAILLTDIFVEAGWRMDVSLNFVIIDKPSPGLMLDCCRLDP